MKRNQTLAKATANEGQEGMSTWARVAQIQATALAGYGEGRAWWLVSPHLK